ncbi:hypothetical protein EI427_03220 [Flammeovirga pectinis]|uniref:DUF3575 domain-containing protein n=1 Tax=Flammeovirga pectinis TaxID=2494373 RepID=A0A3S9NZA8_9BACT|nr:hypothetical protein [Flammeovirga pectinis]AZQ61265.1 hypothetical protein EI427_03220 [Flammeovirga pectinis]
MKLLALFIFLFSSVTCFGQEEEHSTKKMHGREEAHGKLKHHRIALIWAHGYVPKAIDNKDQTVIIPVIGLDYEYWFSHKFAIGLSNDIELTNYVIENHEGEELEREYSYVGAIMGIFEVAPLWVVAVGPGVEIEKNQNFFVAKINIEREFPIAGVGWDVTPMFSYEVKTSNGHGVYDAFNLGIGIGKRF